MSTHSSAARPHVPRPLGRRLLFAALLVLPLLAGCTRGFGAQTDEIYQPGPGITVRQDGVYAINAAIVTDGTGHGTLVTALVNQKALPDKLVSVTVADAKGTALKVTIIGGSVALPPQRGVQLAYTGVVRIEGTLDPGADYQIVMTFQNGAPISTLIPVLPQSADFRDVPIGAIPGDTSTSSPPTP